MQHIPDIIDYNLKILFIGFNPGLKSADVGHHYASGSNRFWKILYESGITPYKMKPEEDVKLPEMGYGSTNIVARPTRGASELKAHEFREGAVVLRKLLITYKPRIACYTGAGVYRNFSGNKAFNYGLQERSIVEGIKDYVCPSPSGLNRMPYNRQLEYFKELKQLL